LIILDAKAMKLEALANAENAMKEQEARVRLNINYSSVSEYIYVVILILMFQTHAFDASIPAQEHGNKKIALSQESCKFLCLYVCHVCLSVYLPIIMLFVCLALCFFS